MVIPRTLKFQGEFLVNNENQSDTVSVYISNGVIFLSDDRNRKKLIIRAFNLSMMLIYSEGAVVQNFEYDISGTEVGFFNHGPLGHPGDNEVDSRRVRGIHIAGNYSTKGLKLEFSGKTTEGESGFGTGEELPAWLFDINFLVPTDEIQSFLQKTDKQFANVSHLLPA